jgi:cytochrome c oxidase cbb3-type subunit 3
MLKARYAIAAVAVLFSTALIAQIGAQTPPPAPAPAPAPQTPAGQPPLGRGRGPGTFPAQQRPPGDPAVIARGKGLYEVTCALCHGIDLRGGQLGGVNLLRSQVVLSDKAGEQILPIVRGARADKGMPPIPMEDEDVKAVAEYIHSIVALSPRQGMPPPPGSPPELNVLVGNAAAGAEYFAAKCASCHSATGDLQGIATRVPDAKALQNLWVSGGTAGGRGGRGGGRGAAGPGQNARAITVTVTPTPGEKVEGRLLRIDDFLVSLVLPDGTVRSFSRSGAIPKVEIHNPLEPHIKLLAEYTDKDMHNVTAYLATLK